MGVIYKSSATLIRLLPPRQSLELSPNNPDAHLNFDGIQRTRKTDPALDATFQSLELKSDNPDVHFNLGVIYEAMGNLDQALASTLQSLELKPNNPDAVNNISGFIEKIDLNPANTGSVTKAYELLLDQINLSHTKLSNIFLQAYLPLIQEASTSNPIISERNKSFEILANDWRFLKSLTLMIPPSQEVERFFTRLRKELLEITIRKSALPQQLKTLTEVLAVQCFLNEYIYMSSQDEEDSISEIISSAADSQEGINKYLAIIGCYKAIHATELRQDLIKNYPTPDDSSKELVTTQLKEPSEEKQLKISLQAKLNITDKISQRVQEMYEKNPYPRFKCSDFTNRELAKPIFKIIELESTRKNQPFSDELSSFLIQNCHRGCGTGNQSSRLVGIKM